MRGSQFVRLSMILIALLGAIAVTTSAIEEICRCLNFDFAGRIVGEFDGSAGDIRLEGAIGLPEWSLAAWMDINDLPDPSSSFGGDLRLTQDWLSIGLIAQQNESQVDVRLQGQANPSSWLLYDGMPTLIGGITAIVEADLSGNVGSSELTLSPFFTGVIPAGDTTVSPSIGIDVSLNSETKLPTVSGSRLVSTVNARSFLIANTVHFSGLFDSFSSLIAAVTVPEWGLTASGSLIPTAAGGFSYGVSIGYEWGDTYLLPSQTEKAESVCTGDVCF
jgi:hypothetical protein